MGFHRRSFSILVFLLLATSAHARTWFIAANGSGDAPTIQAGVDAASPGDTVLVGPGTYTEPAILLTKDLVLVSRDGASATHLAGNASIVITGQNLGPSARIHGFDVGLPDIGGWYCLDNGLVKAQAQLSAWSCIQLDNCSCEVSANTIHGSNDGIRATGAAPVIVDNYISRSLYGIEILSTNALVSGNNVWDCADCIHSFHGMPTITGNSVGGLTYDPCNGIDIGGTATETAHISGNTIKNTDSNAIYVSGSAVIENNRITDGTNVYLYYAQNTTVTGNILINTTFDAQAASAAVEQNTFVGSRVFSALGTFSRNLAYQSEVHCTFSTTLTCNDSWGSPTNYSGTCAGAVGQNGNVSVDPQFCGMPGSGNYFLQADSPCSPQNNSCGQIGALGVGCGPVKTQSATWGSIKAMYRK